MNYNFSFDKKTIAFLLGSSAFVGIMLFIAGLLVGTNWRTEQPALASAATGTQPTAASPAPAAAPAPAPAPAPVQTQPVIINAAPATQESAAPSAAPAPEAAPSPAKQAHSVASLASKKNTTSTQFYDGEVKIFERAKPAATKADDLNQSSFSIQVGVFVDEKDAYQLVRQMQTKGYTPFVLATNDDESRTWYAVRIGTYTDRTEAERAASNIATQEKIKTHVRPLNSL